MREVGRILDQRKYRLAQLYLFHQRAPFSFSDVTTDAGELTCIWRHVAEHHMFITTRCFRKKKFSLFANIILLNTERKLFWFFVKSSKTFFARETRKKERRRCIALVRPYLVLLPVTYSSQLCSTSTCHHLDFVFHRTSKLCCFAKKFSLHVLCQRAWISWFLPTLRYYGTLKAWRPPPILHSLCTLGGSSAATALVDDGNSGGLSQKRISEASFT